MSVKASVAYDKAGFKTTKNLVSQIREALGRTVPTSLKGEPKSLSFESFSSTAARPRAKRARK